LVAWLHAARRLLSDNGYPSGVVRCFSIRQPRIRISTASARTDAQAYALDSPPPQFEIGIALRCSICAMQLWRRVRNAQRRSKARSEQHKDDVAIERSLLEREQGERSRASAADPSLPPARTNDSTYINLTPPS